VTDTITALRDRVLDALTADQDFAGWSWAKTTEVCQNLGFQDDFAASIFPNGVVDVAAHFSDKYDRLMLMALEDVPVSSLRTRDRIRAAVLTRFDTLEDLRPAVRAALAFWALPNHTLQGQRVLWRTADRIWSWAGDNATDYNRQTKRALLSSILVGTTLVWIDDQSPQKMITQAFLDRRIENVMEIGRTIGTMKKVIPNLFRYTKFSS